MKNHRQLTQDLLQIVQSAHFVESLAGLDEDQLNRILAILSDRRTVDGVRRLLVMALDFKRGRRDVKYSSIVDREDSTDFPGILEKLFNDKEQFPAVADIAKFAKNTLGLNIPHKKRSRQTYVRQLSSHISRDPSLRAKSAEILSASLSPKDEAYSILYNYIRGGR